MYLSRFCMHLEASFMCDCMCSGMKDGGVVIGFSILGSRAGYCSTGAVPPFWECSAIFGMWVSLGGSSGSG